MMRTIRRSHAGFTMMEILIVIGIVGVLASMIFPVLASARTKARVAQCTSQLRQLGQALVMYDADHDRVYENYPDRLTNLYALGYVRNPNIFICPMDYTRARKETLKPGNPQDSKSDWRERSPQTDATVSDPTGIGMQDSSYLYEFSTRHCQSYTKEIQGTPGQEYAWYSWIGTGWPTDVLIQWNIEDELDDFGNWRNYDPTVYDPLSPYTVWDERDELVDVIVPPNPAKLDRDGNLWPTGPGTFQGTITWQEAKFWQMANTDAYCSGIYQNGTNSSIPVTWSDEPYYALLASRQYVRNWMPIVRCFWHQSPEMVDVEQFEEVLNLAVDGNTFYSAPGWEQTAWRYSHPEY